MTEGLFELCKLMRRSSSGGLATPRVVVLDHSELSHSSSSQLSSTRSCSNKRGFIGTRCLSVFFSRSENCQRQRVGVLSRSASQHYFNAMAAASDLGKSPTSSDDPSSSYSSFLHFINDDQSNVDGESVASPQRPNDSNTYNVDYCTSPRNDDDEYYDTLSNLSVQSPRSSGEFLPEGSEEGRDTIAALQSKTSLSSSSVNGGGSTTTTADVPIPTEMSHNFAVEHRIFLRAILDMLAEGDQFVNTGSNDTKTLKIGALKKSSRRIKGLWKSKYVEIRRGVFSYYDGHAKHKDTTRKDIPLKAATCTCRAVKSRAWKGAAFELSVKGGPRRIWVANTPGERQGWIQAIHDAMIGASVVRGDNFLDYQMEHDGKTKRWALPKNSPYSAFIEQYLQVREAINGAESKQDYLKALSILRGKSIMIPIQWLKTQLDDSTPTAFQEADMSSGVDQLWKDLLRDSVEINGQVISGESFHGPDRIIGNLTQQIIHHNQYNSCHDGKRSSITEAQAVSYARDIMLATDRTRSGGDSYYCIENLCLNRDLVVICPTSTVAAPLSITVCGAGMIKSNQPITARDVSGWVSTRSHSGKPWRRQYLILSQDVLSCYKDADSRPHNLQAKVMLKGVKVGDSANTSQSSKSRKTSARIIYARNIKKHMCREFLLEDEASFTLWRDALEAASKMSTDINVSINTHPLSDLMSSEKDLTGKSSPYPIVNAEINVSTEYKVCTLDPQGIDNEDTWA